MPPTGAPPRDRGRGRPVVAATAALVVTVAGAALAGVGTRELSRSRADDAARTAVLEAGAQIAVDFLSYDYRHIDRDFQRVASESTGTWRQDFLVQAAGVREAVVRARARSTATTAAAAVADASTTSATVLVALNRKVFNTSRPGGQSDYVQIKLSLVKQGAHWLATGVTAV